jgi:hypothetical protein
MHLSRAPIDGQKKQPMTDETRQSPAESVSHGKLVRQRMKSDCAICTIAMALGRSYEDVLVAALNARAFKPEEGTRSEYSIIEQFGLEQMKDFRILHRGQLAPEFFLHFSWGRRAILAVPSLNIEGGFHSVYWNGSQLFDPCCPRCVMR